MVITAVHDLFSFFETPKAAWLTYFEFIEGFSSIHAMISYHVLWPKGISAGKKYFILNYKTYTTYSLKSVHGNHWQVFGTSFTKKSKNSCAFNWNWYRSGPAGSGKMMRIRPYPDRLALSHNFCAHFFLFQGRGIVPALWLRPSLLSGMVQGCRATIFTIFFPMPRLFIRDDSQFCFQPIRNKNKDDINKNTVTTLSYYNIVHGALLPHYSINSLFVIHSGWG